MGGDVRLTGGCQCGAVRYALHSEPRNASICHCRMCQKAFGSYFAPLAGVPMTHIEWTRGRPATFMSSELAERGFCRECGTPLTFRYVDGHDIEVSLGSLDDPSRVPPTKQVGVESRVSVTFDLATLPEKESNADKAPERVAKLASRQHPDHD